MKQISAVLSVVGGCLILSGCATGYKKMNPWDGLGYTDEQISGGVYYVTYLVNAWTPPEDAIKYWHLRAKELCGSDNYQHDEKLTNHVNKNMGMYGTTTNHNFPYVVGTVKCAGG